jgi:N-methylhydantoinase B
MTREFDAIELEVLWQSLIATVNEQARALQRAAFSPIVREAGDLANAVFDRRGRMVAQAVTGTPGHINSLARAASAILDEYPPDSLVEGDVLITNDPYKTAGQLLDVTVLVPVFHCERVIAFFGSTIHHTDVGGYGIGAGARDVFEEGLWIPIVRLMIAGERNQDVWRFILSNVRQPDHMAGDLHAQMASGEVGAQRLRALCERHGLDDIEDLADDVITRSEAATRASIRKLPAGTYRASAVLDLADGSTIDIVCAVTVDAERGEILVDYAGSSDASPYGINVVRNYTHAYTTFTVRSVLNPELPNNHGSLAPILVEAPVGSIVHAVSPQPCTARHVVGMFLPNALLKALAQIEPERAMAEGSGAVWTMQVSGNHDDGSPFITAMFTYAGGVGARATKPGLSACSYPTGVAAVPVEVVEASAPIRFLRKELRPGSGGSGAQVGGLGQTIEFTVDTPRPWQLNAVTSRLAKAPEGIFGGEAGAAGAFTVNGEPVRTQARVTLAPGDVVRLDLPGGGGYGDPKHEEAMA